MKGSYICLIVLSLVLMVLPGMVLAGGEYASVNINPGSIVWQPFASNGGVALSVLGPNRTYFRRDFGKGESPSMGLADSSGKIFPDGQYSYELVFVPTAGLQTRPDSQAEDGPAAGLTARIQSGNFRISDGQFLIPSSLESSAGKSISASGSITPLDIVQPDDVIIQGSLCGGIDCVNLEVFGFDTLRLKENNTRITFVDTSAAGFPSADWRLRANESAGGGADMFAIDYMGTDYTNGAEAPVTTPFIVSANAPNNSLYISSTGNIGLGTSTPVLDLHAVTNDTPSIRLEQNNSGGFTAQTWDIAGNESNFFVRDVTGGSRLPFRIRPGAPTSSIDISNSGFVGVGIAGPRYKFDVTGGNVSTSQLHFSLDNTDTGGWLTSVLDNNFFFSSGAAYVAGQWIQKSPDNKSVLTGSGGMGYSIFLQNAAVGVGSPITPSLKFRVNYDGSLTTQTAAMLTAGGVWQNASSREYKENIRELNAEKAFETLRNLNPVTYTYKIDPAEKHVGFVAEEVPDLVASRDRKGLSSMDIVAVLTKVVQEQEKAIEEQRTAFEKAVGNLKQEIADLKGLMMSRSR